MSEREISGGHSVLCNIRPFTSLLGFFCYEENAIVLNHTLGFFFILLGAIKALFVFFICCRKVMLLHIV